MKKVSQATLVFCLSVGVILAVPSFLSRLTSSSQAGIILVNGRIEGTEVAVGTKLPGRMAKVLVREGQEVHAGDLIAELEIGDYQATLEQAQANVSQAKHNLENANEQVYRSEEQLAKSEVGLSLIRLQTDLNIKQATAAVKEAEAAVDQATAMRDKTKTEYDHASQLQRANAASDLEYTFARNGLQAQEAGLRMAQLKLEQARDAQKIAESRISEITMQEHDLAVMKSTVRQAKSSVGVAQAQLQASQASERICQIQLKDTKIFAPCDGMVVSRVIEPGEVVSAGSTVMVIVDFDQLYLKGFLPNDQYSQVKLGDPAKLSLDAFPDKTFDAKVTKINQQAEFTPKTVDTPQQRVKLVFGLELQMDNKSRLFRPGMPADAVIKVNPKAEWCKPDDLR